MAQVPKTSVSLLKDLACGTESARWAEFVRMYEEPMRSFLAARFPSVEADDVLQETMIALMRVMPGYHYTPDSGGHFRNYLAGILKHKAEDAIRRRERESGRRERMRRSAADAPRDDGIAARERAEEDEWRLAAMNAAARGSRGCVRDLPRERRHDKAPPRAAALGAGEVDDGRPVEPPWSDRRLDPVPAKEEHARCENGNRADGVGPAEHGDAVLV